MNKNNNNNSTKLLSFSVLNIINSPEQKQTNRKGFYCEKGFITLNYIQSTNKPMMGQ